MRHHEWSAGSGPGRGPGPEPGGGLPPLPAGQMIRPPLEGDDLLRPFVMTGGRTRPADTGLQVETQVRALTGADPGELRFEHRQIVELCREPQSVVEVAIRLGMPLGVARVLVADLVADGLLVQQQFDLSIDILERIRDRVRAL